MSQPARRRPGSESPIKLHPQVEQVQTSSAQPQAATTEPNMESANRLPEPKWLTFERKETRQRPDQIAWIEAKRKELNLHRGRAGERLTDNTLIRVALDLLRLHENELRGSTEAELRASLGMESHP